MFRYRVKLIFTKKSGHWPVWYHGPNEFGDENRAVAVELDDLEEAVREL